MLHALPLFRRLLAAAAFAPVVAAWSLGGCNTGFTDEECTAALDRCGYFWVPEFCRYYPSECTIGGELYPDTEHVFYIPPNQTMTIDLSLVRLPERAVDLWFAVCGDSQGSREDFQIQLDGIDASTGEVSHLDEEEFHRFPGHTGPPRKLEVTWKGTTNGEVLANPPPKSCVSLGLQDRVCVDKAMNRECYTPDTE